jgi:hypothetical protein
MAFSLDDQVRFDWIDDTAAIRGGEARMARHRGMRRAIVAVARVRIDDRWAGADSDRLQTFAKSCRQDHLTATRV